jgi:hypothetical protein
VLWSDESNEWTPQLKKELNVADADDGIFFMNLKRFPSTLQ